MTSNEKHGPQDPDAPASDEPIIAPLPAPEPDEDEDEEGEDDDAQP